MHPSNTALKEFKELYLKKYGVKLSDSEANEKAYRLLVFYRFKNNHDRHD